jgi:hypothetical protein
MFVAIWGAWPEWRLNRAQPLQRTLADAGGGGGKIPRRGFPRPGAFVRCAVTNVPLPLEELKYWSVELQEAYSTPEAVLQRHYPGRLKPD